MIAEDMVLIW